MASPTMTLVLVLAALSGISARTVYPSSTPASEEKCVLDMAFVLDSSVDVSSEYFERVREQSVRLLERIARGELEQNLAAAFQQEVNAEDFQRRTAAMQCTFDNDPRDWHFSASEEEAQRTIRGFNYLESVQATVQTIDFMAAMYRRESSEKHVKVAVLFTDDVANRDEVRRACEAAKVDGITVITVGIKEDTDMPCHEKCHKPCQMDNLDRIVQEITTVLKTEAPEKWEECICIAKPCKCRDGEQGRPGPRGEHGMTGEVGRRGSDGPKGPDGPNGRSGKAGGTGKNGRKGEPGPTGTFGTTGLPGKQGPPGLQGGTGKNGMKGVDGPKGDNGPCGHWGITGKSGPDGPQGYKGESGIGIQGPKGDDGKAGDAGSMGPPGKGVNGPPGQPGNQGHGGCVGDNGDSLPGTPGERGNPGAPGPKGEHGVGWRGLTGDIGFPGDQGPNGLPGLDTVGAKGRPGEPGPPGAPGCKGKDLTGLPGMPGFPGQPGAQGNDHTGAAGLQGVTGKDGVPGKPGMPGPDGASGIKGATGKPGPKGPTGKDGVGFAGVPGGVGQPGRPGQPGFPGHRGNPGEKGTPGTNGKPGMPGPQGPSTQGDKGNQGPVGPPGCTGSSFAGPKGPKGMPGRPGEPGHAGATGTGVRGEKGLRGLDGAKGEPGIDGTGRPGPPGSVGSRGIRGPDGPSGKVVAAANGEPGSRGITGIKGCKGVDIVGPTGAPGETGETGPMGPQGVGYPGEKGLIGAPGKDGPPGCKGDNGRDGLPGKDGARGPPGTAGLTLQMLHETITAVCGCSTTTTCWNKPLELVFIVDSSGSIGRERFENDVKPFVRNLMEKFTIGQGPKDTRVAVVLYSNTATVEFNLDKCRDKEHMRSLVNGLEHRASGTYTGAAIKMATEECFMKKARKGVTRVAIVITDGESNNYVNLVEAVDEAKAQNVVMHAVGIHETSSNFQKELNYIASEPKEKHTHTVKSTGALAEKNWSQLITQVCATTGASDIKRVDRSRCDLPQKQSGGSTWTEAWSYCKHTNTCNDFYYGGSNGNANRFETEQECRNACM